jgi:ATP/maltotriose-dependent transcriptional regulator MalT
MTSSTATRQIGPRRVIERPRLTRMLDETNARIILLTAPAGYGKTTLALQWLAGRPSAWYRGTPASADVAALALGLAVAATEIVPGADQRLRERLRATSHPEEETDVLAELLAENLGAWPDDAWLAIDDYQFAMKAEAPERFMGRLLELASLRLFVTSRNRPSWATARRILYGEVYELEHDALAMSDDEARDVLAHRGEHVPILVERAEGWPAVIGLAALTESLTLPEGDLPAQLYDFFAEELYNQAEPTVRWGLCQLAIAPMITTELAEHVFGVETGTLILEHGVRLGVFVGERPGAYGLHPLLRTFLRAKLREQRPQASDWMQAVASFLLSRRRWDDAFSVIEEFPSEDAFAELLQSALDEMLREGRLSTVHRWVHAGRTQRMTSPLLDLAEAEVAFRRGDYVHAHALATQAGAGLGPKHPFAARALLRAGKSAHLNSRDDVALTLHQRAQAVAKSADEAAEAVLGKLTAALELENDEVDQISEELDGFDPDSPRTTLRLLTGRGQFAIRRGCLREELDRLVEALPLVAAVDDPLARSSFCHVTSYALAMAGRYQEALKLVQTAVLDAERYRIHFAIRHGLVTQAIAYLGLRNFTKAAALLDRAGRIAVDAGDSHVEWAARAIAVRLEIMRGHQPDLPVRGRSGLRKLVARAMYGEYLASLALAEACGGEGALAFNLADKAERATQAAETRSLVAWTRAIVEHRRSKDAGRLICSAFDETQQLGFIDLTVCAYRGYMPALGILAHDAARRTSLRQILADARDFALAGGVGLEIPRPAASRVQVLTKREGEVFELLRQGMSNRAIAETLFITEATAKLHVRHILAKLGVRRRTEAALLDLTG